jgi:[NiFe] hydrogenase diaphorase moiety large subunit
MGSQVQSIVEKHGNDASRLMDIFIDLSHEAGCVSQDDIFKISGLLNMSSVDVEQTLSFYHFFSKQPTGKYSIYLNDSLVAEMMGRAEIAEAFEKATATNFGRWPVWFV